MNPNMNIGRGRLFLEQNFAQSATPHEPRRISLSDIQEITNYCRTCNVKLRTPGGVNSHTKQAHEVLKLKTLHEESTPRRSEFPSSRHFSPYETLENIDYSIESELHYGKHSARP